MTKEEEAKRLRNITEGVGCPHGRDPEGVCIPCDQKQIELEAKAMSSEGGLSGPPFEPFAEAYPVECDHIHTITSCIDCGEVMTVSDEAFP